MVRWAWPLRVSLVVLLFYVHSLLASGPDKRGRQEGSADNDMVRVVIVHHKAGTVFTRNLARITIGAAFSDTKTHTTYRHEGEWRDAWLDARATVRRPDGMAPNQGVLELLRVGNVSAHDMVADMQGGQYRDIVAAIGTRDYRIIHVVRNPHAMVASSAAYHRWHNRTNEPWEHSSPPVYHCLGYPIPFALNPEHVAALAKANPGIPAANATYRMLMGALDPEQAAILDLELCSRCAIAAMMADAELCARDHRCMQLELEQSADLNRTTDAFISWLRLEVPPHKYAGMLDRLRGRLSQTMDKHGTGAGEHFCSLFSRPMRHAFSRVVRQISAALPYQISATLPYPSIEQSCGEASLDGTVSDGAGGGSDETVSDAAGGVTEAQWRRRQRSHHPTASLPPVGADGVAWRVAADATRTPLAEYSVFVVLVVVCVLCRFCPSRLARRRAESTNGLT
eukprot:TRINITY_DN2925_c0_g1_i1.p1 TRINITY_DN2925_c0_g1~~TRINITY_DN2925_c0_g1_i1.p1  ORF type:complete len:468 (+),score=90.15 TRINITY_DN2925_c0_g1_i1:48-1406(+)